MATDKNNKYDYKKVTLYFDLNNHSQNEAYNLIKKAGHKQTKLIGILVHHFLQQFGQAELSETDLKNYIQSYSTICKANMGMPYIQHIPQQPNIFQMPSTSVELHETNTPVVANNALSETVSYSIPSTNVTSNTPEEIISEDLVSEEDMNYINSMMGGFSL